MLQVLNLALPFFGLILIGFLSGRLKRLPDAGLAWMNFFIVYVSLPALFFRILARTPFEQLARPDFICATALATSLVFALSFVIGLLARRGRIREATLVAVAGGFGNVGYMGPGLALATVGPDAAAPVALIFSFDAMLVFALVPMLMAFSGSSEAPLLRVIWQAVHGIVTNPLLISAAAGVTAAAFRFEPPTAVEKLLDFLFASAAPCALFALGVTVALRPMARLPREVPPIVAVKLLVHPALVFVLLPLFGSFDAGWVNTAVLMAALPPALTAYVFARQYNAWIEEASGSILIGTVASILTLTAVMYLVQSGAIAR
ncbi:MAG: AEC family transporter [Hyphomicrobiaceae bacterium]|nr:AEC family transporter [Hyphomicrobiaceae bacterium]